MNHSVRFILLVVSMGFILYDLLIVVQVIQVVRITNWVHQLLVTLMFNAHFQRIETYTLINNL